MKLKDTHGYGYNSGLQFQKDKLSYLVNEVSCTDEHIDFTAV